jgi:hypothetical protein
MATRQIAACFNEARYRAGRLDDRLLADVTKEAGKNHLAATAEMLRVAERLGRRREAKVARKWLERRSRSALARWNCRSNRAAGLLSFRRAKAACRRRSWRFI